jgi:NADH-quinone oxidoreductase subunit L
MSYLIIFLPLIGAILGYSIKALGDRYTEVITTTFLFLSAILSIIIFYNGIAHEEYANYKIIEWISS